MDDATSLLDRIDRAIARSRESGALEPLSTNYGLLREAGIDFVVWRAERIDRKEEATRKQRETDEPSDPFAPPYGDLFVDDVSETHVCLLNKFNVLERHALIVTRQWEDQGAMITFEDFEALWRCLFEVDGLGFYNSSPVSGASQAHKHLQLVDLPMVEEVEGVPMAARFEEASLEPGEVGCVGSLPFEHALVRLDVRETDVPRDVARASYRHYQTMLEWFGHPPVPSYNLLVTRRWMWMVPRVREHWRGISINALGFAGSLLVRDDETFEALEAAGPMQVLSEVSGGS